MSELEDGVCLNWGPLGEKGFEVRKTWDKEEIIITLLHINKISSQAHFCPSFFFSADLGFPTFSLSKFTITVLFYHSS